MSVCQWIWLQVLLNYCLLGGCTKVYINSGGWVMRSAGRMYKMAFRCPTLDMEYGYPTTEHEKRLLPKSPI